MGKKLSVKKFFENENLEPTPGFYFIQILLFWKNWGGEKFRVGEGKFGGVKNLAVKLMLKLKKKFSAKFCRGRNFAVGENSDNKNYFTVKLQKSKIPNENV